MIHAKERGHNQMTLCRQRIVITRAAYDGRPHKIVGGSREEQRRGTGATHIHPPDRQLFLVPSHCQFTIGSFASKQEKISRLEVYA